MELACFEQSHEAEVTKGTEAACHAFGELEQAVDGLDDAVGDAGFQEGDDACPVLHDAAGEFAKRQEPGPARAGDPPAQRLRVFAGEHVLQGLTQHHRAPKLGIVAGQLCPQSRLLGRVRPHVAADRPEGSRQLGSLAPQEFAHVIQGFAGHLCMRWK